jgi:hypothetical protein
MIVYVLFVHKNKFQREKFVLFSLKIKNFKKPKKTFVVGVLGGFFWVGFLGGFFIANPGSRRIHPAYMQSTSWT